MPPRYPSLSIPRSWYCVAPSQELRTGAVLGRTVAGREVVVFRTASGRVAAVDAYCPHLGAHLAFGGKVDGECIRCPFHGFTFATDGTCSATGYGTRPPSTARLGTWAAREINGFVFVWYAPDGRSPTFEIPAVDVRGWTPWRTQAWPLPVHVQDIAENAVDLGHLRWVHAFESIRALGPTLTEGPLLKARYTFERPVLPLPGSRGALRAEIEIFQHGLGYAIVNNSVPTLGLQIRHLVLATPMALDRVELRIAQSIRRASGGPLHFLPDVVQQRLVSPLLFAGYAQEVRKDFEIWTHKRYVERPALAEGDGPIGIYRRWARQFYPEADVEAARPAAPAPS